MVGGVGGMGSMGMAGGWYGWCVWWVDGWYGRWHGGWGAVGMHGGWCAVGGMADVGGSYRNTTHTPCHSFGPYQPYQTYIISSRYSALISPDTSHTTPWNGAYLAHDVTLSVRVSRSGSEGGAEVQATEAGQCMAEWPSGRMA